jgi:hypothetical protein
LRFTNDAVPNQSYYDEAFGALGYNDGPLLTKAAPMPAAAPAPLWGAWATGAGNWQRSTVGGVTTNSTTGSGVGGLDYTKIGVFAARDAWVIGVDGSGSETTSAGTRATTPAVGAYTAYINGPFSADFSFLAAFTDTSATAGVTTQTRADAYSYTGDLNYRFDLLNSWWFEPTVGATYGNTFLNVPGAPVGEIVTVQGGARLGNEFDAGNGVKVQSTFFGLAYSNVVESAGGLGLPPTLTGIASGGGLDKGQVWGKGDAKFNFVFNPHFSAYIEGNIYGTSGTFTALGYGVLGGLRYVF